MKTLKITTAFAALALLSGAALASGEHCVTRSIEANYNGGDVAPSTQCYSSESNFKKRVEREKCEHEQGDTKDKDAKGLKS